MAKKRVLQDFLDRKDVFLAPGHPFPLDWADLQNTWPDDKCYLVAITERQLNIIHSLLTFAHYYRGFWGFPTKRLWSNDDIERWDTIKAYLADLEDCLMSGCDVSVLITTIENQTTALVDALAIVNILGLDDIRDGLANWQIQDNTNQGNRNADLSAIHTELDQHTDLHTNRNDRLSDLGDDLGKVADRIAPDGDNLFSPLTDIESTLDAFRKSYIECCEKLEVYPSPPSNPGLILVPPNPNKCELAARAIGANMSFWRVLREAGPYVLLGMTIGLAYIGPIALSIGGISLVTTTQVAEFMSNMSWNGYVLFMSQFEDSRDAYLTAIYDAQTVYDAKAAIVAHNAGIDWLMDSGEDLANAIFSNLQLTIVFSGELSRIDEEFNDWYNGDCSGSCCTSSVWTGTPRSIGTEINALGPGMGNMTSQQEMSSEFIDGEHRIEIALHDGMTIHLDNPSRSFLVDEYNGDACCDWQTPEIDKSYYDQIECVRARLHTNDGPFTVDVQVEYYQYI